MLESFAQVLLGVVELVDLGSVRLFDSVELGPVLGRNLGHHHLVVGLATILQQNLEHFPQRGQDRVLVIGMLNTFEDHFVETDRVDKETAIDALDVSDGHALTVQEQLVDLVATDRLLVHGLHDRAGDLEVLCVAKRFVDPSLDHTGVQRGFRSVLIENLADSSFEVLISRAIFFRQASRVEALL